MTMNKERLKRKTVVNTHTVGSILMFSSVLFCAMSFVSCKDNNFDLDDIDATIGIGSGELNIPTSSTTTIKLSEVLDLEENGDVKEDADGTYRFYNQGDNVKPTEISIDEVTVRRASSKSEDFVLDLSSAAKAKTRSSVTINEEKEIGSFEYTCDLPKEITELKMSETKSEIAISLSFNSNMQALLSSIDELSIYIPNYMDYTVESSTSTYKQEGNRIKLTNVSTQNAQKVVISINKLTFNKPKDELGYLGTADSKVSMLGNIKLGIMIDSELNLTENVDPKNCVIENKIEFMDDLTLKNVTGRFSPSIELKNIGNTTISGLPDFLDEDGVKIDIDNPQIILSLNSDLTVPCILKGSINYERDGQKGAIELNEDIVVKPSTGGNTVTRICVCRKKTGLANSNSFDQIIEQNNLKDLFYPTLVNSISFDASAKADDSQESSFELGRTYTIQPQYEINAPLAFGEDAKIIYTEVFDDWNKDVKDYDIKEGGYIQMTANVVNCVPVFLNVAASPLDLNGNDMGNDVKVEVVGEVAASQDGVTPTSSALTIKLTPSKGALKRLDGLKLTISGSAKSEGSGTSVVGIPLNANKHSLVAKDIAIKIVGTVIVDLN